MSSPHRPTFVKLVKHRGWTRGAELGVQKGILFSLLLTSCHDLNLLGVDLGVDPIRRERCEGIAAQFSDRATFLVSSTHDAAQLVGNGSLDFVFIDADHSYEAVKDDIACWKSKVRRGGWLGGHDYNQKFPGVVRAVDEAFGFGVKRWDGSIWGVWA
jgi:predicted O-methyltransferase YrrM